MSAVPERSVPPPGACPVCATPVADVTERCPECGYDLAGIPPRPSAYSRGALVWTIAGFVVIYVLLVTAVALAN